MPAGFVLARFLRFYGAGVYWGAYPTRDGIIPVALFDMLLAMASHVEAHEAELRADGVALGYAAARAGDHPAVRRAMRALQRAAAPVVYVRPAGAVGAGAPDDGGR